MQTLKFNVNELKALSDALDEYVYQLDCEIDYAQDNGEGDKETHRKQQAACAVHDRIYDALAIELDREIRQDV
jgi:hypothetical protein